MNKHLLYSHWILFITLWSMAGELPGHYQVVSGTAVFKEKQVVLLRKFTYKNSIQFLTADPETFKTAVIPSASLTITGAPVKESPYSRALQSASFMSDKLQDAGITHGFPDEKGIVLTIDLCPSQKPLDRVIFNTLISALGKKERPVPVALSVTGKFILTHQEDIDWLKSLQQKGILDITWINHSFSHFYDPSIPLSENFLLKPGTNMESEILENEKLMISLGLIPSVFFRFPGLVSDRQVFSAVTAYGLIPVGSDAWLAKGQKPYGGSIVLIHGNGNEPLGVQDFLRLLRQEQSQVYDNQWLLFDLRESVSKEFNN